MPSFTKKTYVMVADTIKEGLEKANGQLERGVLADACANFSRKFHNDNPAFKPMAFAKACGFDVVPH